MFSGEERVWYTLCRLMKRGGRCTREHGLYLLKRSRWRGMVGNQRRKTDSSVRIVGVLLGCAISEEWNVEEPKGGDKSMR